MLTLAAVSGIIFALSIGGLLTAECEPRYVAASETFCALGGVSLLGLIAAGLWYVIATINK